LLKNRYDFFTVQTDTFVLKSAKTVSEKRLS
jgi:hypothetical protein